MTPPMKLILTLATLAFATNPTENPGTGFPELLSHLRETALSEPVKLGKGDDAYKVFAHHPTVAKKLQSTYDTPQLAEWKGWLTPSLKIAVSERGIVQAAERMTEGKKDPTNYDAVWVRDSLWAYLGLSASAETSEDADRVLVSLWNYFASPKQLERIKSVTANPSKLSGKDGAMNAPHIRFDGKSKTFADVHVGKKPQTWNHKQNDALGLWLDLTVRAVMESDKFNKSDWTASRLDAVAKLPGYFKAVKFYEMEDAGSWEEIERTNTSSMGLVVSALERLQELSANKKKESFYKALRKHGLLSPKEINTLVELGYQRIRKQLDAGGESPLYPEQSSRHRKSDAALLNLIYPARLTKLSAAHKEKVLAAVQPLVGEVGVKRYLEDSYQSGNFWFPKEKQTLAEKTDDTSSASSFAKRGKQFLNDTEAQWFFDSWMSVAYAALLKETGRPEFRAGQLKHFNRALGQVTGDNRLGADGRPVPGMALPESYNTVVDGTDRFYAPSPITPLNWAKASLRLAIESLRGSLPGPG